MLTTKIIGAKISEARKKLDVSQAQLAERLFISPQAVGKWERGESMPDIITLNNLAGILEVDLNYFSENFPSQSNEIESPKQAMELTLPDGKRKNKLSWDMSSGNWADADFSGLKNLHEKFSSSNMQRCLFIGSDLSGLLLKSNNIDRCDFSGSDISSSRIQGSNLANSSFKGCCLKETEFSGSHVMSSDFTDADLSDVIFKSGGFQSNPIVNTVLNRTSFNSMYLADLVFGGSLEDCSFENCQFSKVTFQNATLKNTFFRGSNLKKVLFIDCKVDKLTYAFLKSGKADLSGITVIAM